MLFKGSQPGQSPPGLFPELCMDRTSLGSLSIYDASGRLKGCWGCSQVHRGQGFSKSVARSQHLSIGLFPKTDLLSFRLHWGFTVFHLDPKAPTEITIVYIDGCQIIMVRGDMSRGPSSLSFCGSLLCFS